MKSMIVGTVALLLSVAGVAHGQVLSAQAVQRQLQPSTQSLLQSLAPSTAAGDYQAMRNTAFTWSTDAAKQDPRAAVVGCAWYAQIMQRHKDKVHEGDASNRSLYCGRLTRDALQDAMGLSARIGRELDAVQAGSKSAKTAVF
ncbi:MAG TPA: hypothetical protein VFI62_08605 [Burkholderiales bacterium]|nr:hypothetical protein [Burkholderiales bacterium]